MISIQSECQCTRCRASISSDEIGLSKKLINRAATDFFCLNCLAYAFDVTIEYLQETIAYYKRIGCTLFVKPEEW